MVLVAGDPGEHSRVIDAETEIGAAADRVKAKGCDRHNYVRFGPAQENRTTGVARTRPAPGRGN